MKTLYRITLIFYISALFIQPVHSQRLLKRLQDKVQERVENKVEERVEQKTDEVIDNQLDKIEQSLENSDGNATNASDNSGADADAIRQERLQNVLKNIGVSGEPVPFADNYSFNHLIHMHIDSYDKNGKKNDESEFITHLNPETQSMAYQMVSGNMEGNKMEGLFIIDAENGATIMLNEEKGKKTGIVYGMGAFFASIGEAYEDEEALDETPETFLQNQNVKKTGRTKTVAGYKCEEYKYTDEENESEIWVTTDLKMNTRDFFSTLFKTSLYSHGIPWGYMMEATSVDKETGEKAFMQVTRVETNLNTRFSMGDYEITNLGSFTMPTTE